MEEWRGGEMMIITFSEKLSKYLEEKKIVSLTVDQVVTKNC
jgi:hypothetical protein